MNPLQARQFNMRHQRFQPELHWRLNQVVQRHNYDRLIPPLVAAQLQLENPLDVTRFEQNLRIILQRQRVHFDMGEGDGLHVWSWRLAQRPTDLNGGGAGGGDEMRPLPFQRQQPLRLNAETRQLI